MKSYISNYTHWNSKLQENVVTLEKTKYVRLFEDEELDNLQREIYGTTLKEATDSSKRKLIDTRNWITAPTRHLGIINDELHNLKVKIIDHPSIQTMATDGVHLFINPFFGASLTLDEFIFVILHEVLHNQWLHFYRQTHPSKKLSKELQHTLWNIATDLEINPRLERNPALEGKIYKDGLFLDKPISQASDYIFKSTEWKHENGALMAADHMFMKLIDIMERHTEEEKEKEEEGGQQEDMGPADLKVGDIIHDKASGKFGKITNEDGNGDFEMTEMTNEEVISELKNPPGDIDIQIPMTPEQIAKRDSQDTTGGESDMIDIIDKIDVTDL
jgi:hypothetical protein